MANINTGIEWCDRTWTPTTGCDKVSPGCTHCYAEAITKRFHNIFPNGFTLMQYPERLKEPLTWQKASRIFVNSMSDLFHEEVTLECLKQVFDVMRETPHHIYQILTKRHERLLELAPKLDCLIIFGWGCLLKIKTMLTGLIVCEKYLPRSDFYPANRF